MKSVLAADGATIAYRLRRPGAARRTLVLVHGLASNHTRWNEFVSTTRLRDSWDLLRVDLRGFGDSVTRRRTGFAEWSRDIAAILDAEHVERAVVAGHCLGANIAIHFAARHPTKTAGLVLIEPMFREALGGMPRTLLPTRPLVHALTTLIRAVNRLGIHRRRLATLDLEQLDREARAVMQAKGTEAFPEDRYGSALEDLKFTPTAVYLTGLVALGEPMPDLRRIAAPVLALLSTGGRFGDPAITARRLAQLPHSDTRTLTARHWIPTERPTEMREAIDGWCSTMRA